MDRFLNLLVILFAVFLLALPLTGCTDSAFTLVLKVDTPHDGAIVKTPTVTVSGHVSGIERAGAKVSINGADVPVKEDKFSTVVTLTEGKNVVNIDAASGAVKLNEKVNVTCAPGKK
jgi:hypothetical protein